jgi:hypothetical protein
LARTGFWVVALSCSSTAKLRVAAAEEIPNFADTVAGPREFYIPVPPRHVALIYVRGDSARATRVWLRDGQVRSAGEDNASFTVANEAKRGPNLIGIVTVEPPAGSSVGLEIQVLELGFFCLLKERLACCHARGDLALDGSEVGICPMRRAK